MLGKVGERNGLKMAAARSMARDLIAEARKDTRAADPEHANVLECAALERLHNAVSLPESEAAWAQSQIEFAQAGIGVPLAVEGCYHDRRETLSGLD